MADDAFTSEEPQPLGAVPLPGVSPRQRVTHAIDEDTPPRDRMRVWRWRTGCALATACFIGGLTGLMFGATVGRFVKRPRPEILAALGCLLGAGIVGFGVYRSTSRLPGRGERVSTRELPTAVPSRTDFSRHARSSSVTNQLTLPLAMPPRHVDRLTGSKRGITSVAIAPDGRLAVAGNAEGRVILWDVQTGFELFSLPAFKKRTTAVAFSPDGTLLAGAGLDRQWKNDVASVVHIWDAASGQELRRIEIEKGLFSMTFLPDPRQLLLGGHDYVRVWELDGPSPVSLIEITEGVFSTDEMRAVAVASDGKIALAGGWQYSDIWLVNLASGEKVRRLRGHKSSALMLRRPAITSLAFSPDGLRALSGCLDQTAKVWNVLTGETTRTFSGHAGFWGWRGVVGVAWLPDGKRAISASEDGTLRIWEVDSGRECDRREHGGAITCLAVTPDGRMALTGGNDGVVRVFTLG